MTRQLAAIAMALSVLLPVPAATAQDVAGRAVFTDRRNPPSFEALAPAGREYFEFGQAIFNTPWVPAGLGNAARRDGLGPLYVSASCDGCHNNGARGRGEADPARLSNSFVMQLGGAAIPVYGHVLNTQALTGHAPEGRIEVSHIERRGRYPDGMAWRLLAPRYRVKDLSGGALPEDAVLRPRIGPALFGAGLLEAVPQAELEQIRLAQPRRIRGRIAGRFGWQAEAVSIEDQTARAFAREMGLTSAQRPQDDCSARQPACLGAVHGGSPEVSAEFFGAVVSFQRNLAVPARPLPGDASLDSGAVSFERVGCAHCHRPRLPVLLAAGAATIDAYTDLLVHDLGPALADRSAADRPVKSLWRTAPLWGLAHALQNESVALLHDGRARTLEEAILWHGGQAEPARRAFMQLPRGDRERLLAWLATL